MSHRFSPEWVGMPLFLTLVFTLLKASGAVGWSWWGVVSPLLVAVVLAVVVLVVVAGGVLIVALIRR